MLNFYFLNVLHGDSIVIEYANNGTRSFGVIDSNVSGNSPPKALNKLQELGAEHLSFICITHPHADHYRGMYDIMQHYAGRIDHLYTFPVGDLLNNTDRLKKYAQQLVKLTTKHDDEGLAIRSVELLQILKHAHEVSQRNDAFWLELVGTKNTVTPPGFDGVGIDIIMPPPRAKGAKYITQIINQTLDDPENIEANEISLALRITYNEKSIVLGGDACYENWTYGRRIYKGDITGDVVKLPHHGSKYDCNDETLPYWFRENGNKVGIISAKGSKHPDHAVLDWLLQNKITPYCTNLSSRWNNKSSVVDFVNTTDLEGDLKRLVRQRMTSRSHTTQPCKGDIHVQISVEGKVNIETQYNNICGCNVNALDDLFSKVKVEESVA